MKKKVVVGMSGGVDSSVAAYLLKEQGYDVIGVTMQIWQDESQEQIEDNGGCCGITAVDDARRVAMQLDIPYYVMNFKNEFKKNVIDYFTDEYIHGRTPNPCIACNRHVKWESLLKRSLEIGADCIATGHYLSACFATCVKEKDEKALEGILGVKAGLGNLENGMSAMMGGGKSYLPAEQLRLDFYSNNRLDDKFKTLMSEYMIAQQQENSIDSLRKTEEITNRHFEMLIDSARMKNDSAAIVSIRKTMGMASLFGGVKYKLLSSFVISATRHYWKITDQQNVGEKKKCIAWVNYAYQLDRTPATAWGCADLLEEIGEKQGAKKLLNDVLEVIKNNSLSDADPKDIQSVTERVEKM